MPVPIRLFISYSHKDDAFREELETALALLKRQGLLLVWHDRRIDPGALWKAAIDAELEAADIILLLVSADFLASDYCHDKEMKRAVERSDAGEAIVIPIIVRSCDWQSALFARFEALPKDGKPVKSFSDRDEAWTEVVRGIRAAVEKRTRGTGARAPSPSLGKTGRMPTRASLRRLLGEMLKSDSDLEAFCLDFFEGIHRRFTSGMERKQKVTLLLQHASPEEILKRLREHDAASVGRNEAMIEYETR